MIHKYAILMLILVSFLQGTVPTAAQTVEVSLGIMSDTTGAQIALPVKVSDVTGLGIGSYSAVISFDANVLVATGVSVGGTLTESWGSPTMAIHPGQISLAAAGAVDLAGAGTLINLLFNVVGKPGDRTVIKFVNLMFNEGSPAANLKDGYFKIPKFEVTHGPIVGAVTATSARFVVHTDTAAWVKVYLAQDTTTWSKGIYSTVVETNAANDYFGLLEATGLKPSSTYFYRSVIDGQPKPKYVGRFKTFPAPGQVEPFRFLFGSCQQAYYDDPRSGFGFIFPKMAQEGALFFLQQGDWIYPDTTDREQGDSLNFFAKHVDQIFETYRDRYDPNFPMIELLKVTPVDFTYDDHDWVDNNCDGTYMNLGGSNSIQVYQQAFPHYPLANASKGVWHKFTCGNVDVFMIDNRAQRDPNLNALQWLQDRFVFKANFLDNHSILGAEQMNWLLDQLKASTATWKFISSGTPFNPAWRGLIELALLLQGTPYDPIVDPATGQKASMAFLAGEFVDKWAGFPSDIYKLLKAIIENNIQNVIFLSGDTHTSAIDDGTHSLIPELMDCPLDRTNSQIVAVAKEGFKVDIWNKGGQTYQNALPNDLGNTYGRVSVFGRDSVKLEVVSETGRILAAHTVLPGIVPRRVAGVIVPGGMDFGTVQLGAQAATAVIAISTSIDTFKISNVVVTPIKGASQFVALKTSTKLLSGQADVFPFAFIPQGKTGDTCQAMITFVSNDPAGLKIIGAQGIVGTQVAVDDPSIPMKPLVHQLYPNYPNPFNPETMIRFATPIAGHVKLYITNVLGQRIRTLLDSDVPAGYQSLIWDGKNDDGELAAAGIYLVVMKAGDVTQWRKITLIK
ncbi:MAG: alkaline phosphatase D family protein [candidate division KSB1 bacterium]|nr:alkaline phosphatase D family protein [candidate division KSB1 bacterium]